MTRGRGDNGSSPSSTSARAQSKGTPSLIVRQHINVDPRRRSSADFAIVARLDADGDEAAWEQLLARQLSSELFKICCIPFFVYGLSLGDVVRAPLDEKRRYVITEIVEKSGHRTLRVSLRRNALDKHERARLRGVLLESVNAAQGGIEFFSGTLLGIDAPTDQSYEAICNELKQRERAGELEYEEGDA